MAVINVGQPILQSAIITVVLWLLLVSLALFRLRKVAVEARMNEIPKLMILAFSAAAAGTLAITVAVALFFPSFIEIDLGTVYTAGLLGAAISLWWTFAVFWREIRTVQKLAPETESKTIPPPPPQQAQTSQQAQQAQTSILGGDELQRILDHIITDRKKVEELERKNKNELQDLTQELSQLCASIDQLRSKYDPTWDSGLRGQVIVIYKQLSDSGSAMVQRDYGKAQEHFDTSYQVAIQLKHYLESKSKGQRTTEIPSVQRLLPALREWVTRWEQYERLDYQQKWQMISQDGIQQSAKEISGRLLSLDSEYAESWDQGMRNQVQIVSSDLQKFGLRKLTVLAGDKELQRMEDLGWSAYNKSKALLSFLTTR